MTSEVAIIGLTYDGTDLQRSDLSLFLEIRSGLYDGLEVRGEDVTIPYLAGQIARPRRRHKRDIILGGHVRGEGIDRPARLADYIATFTGLDVLFDPARMPADLVATFIDLSTATIECRPLPMVLVPQVPEEFAQLTVPFVSVEPDWTFETAGS